MINPMMDVNLDSVIDMLAFIRSCDDQFSPEVYKDALGILLPDDTNLDLEDLWLQVDERAKVLK